MRVIFLETVRLEVNKKKVNKKTATMTDIQNNNNNLKKYINVIYGNA